MKCYRRLRHMAIRDRYATTRSLENEWSEKQGHPVTFRMVYRCITYFLRYFGHFRHSAKRYNIGIWNGIRSSFLMNFDSPRVHMMAEKNKMTSGEEMESHLDVEHHINMTVGGVVWGAIAHASHL